VISNNKNILLSQQ